MYYATHCANITDPAVIDQEWDPAQVDKGLKSQLLELAEAGYNIKEVWFGPEKVSNRSPQQAQCNATKDAFPKLVRGDVS